MAYFVLSGSVELYKWKMLWVSHSMIWAHTRGTLSIWIYDGVCSEILSVNSMTYKEKNHQYGHEIDYHTNRHLNIIITPNKHVLDYCVDWNKMFRSGGTIMRE